jgi:hypothetical protein
MPISDYSVNAAQRERAVLPLKRHGAARVDHDARRVKLLQLPHILRGVDILYVNLPQIGLYLPPRLVNPPIIHFI